ncbi:MAG: hypothetical protein AAF607_02195 [Pseudomonadota bacterium]
MDTLERLFAFINSYPVYSKVGVVAGIFFVIAILLFSPRQAETTVNKNSVRGRMILEIGEVRLFPQNSDLDIRVIAIAGGTEYVHPSVGGVEWMKTGPQMSHKTIQLPNLGFLNIRFEIEFRDGNNLVGDSPLQAAAKGKFVSQSMVDIDLEDLPYEGVYSLYEVNQIQSRAPNIGAEIDFKIYNR